MLLIETGPVLVMNNNNVCCTQTSPPVLSPTTLPPFLDISARHLADVRREDPTFPAPRMVGSLPRWTRESILAWVHGAAETLSDAGTSTTSSKRTAASATRVTAVRDAR